MNIFALLFAAVSAAPAANSSSNSTWPSECGPECQAIVKAALQSELAELASNVTTDPFFQTPNNFSSYSSGEVVRWQDLIKVQAEGAGSPANTTFAVPMSMSLSRFMYVSEDINGTKIPATSFVLLPYTSSAGTNATLPTIAWTHGTYGIGRQCASSNNAELWYSWEGPFALAQAGYAVIGPDYSGLGTEIPGGFKYEAGWLHAIDTTYAVQAAQSRMSSKISKDWVVVGHSEGGQAAWRTNEYQGSIGGGPNSNGFLGAVSCAPALQTRKLIPATWESVNGGPVGNGEEMFYLETLARTYPSLFKVEDYATEDFIKGVNEVQEGCLPTWQTLFSNFTVKELYKNSSWPFSEAAIRYETELNKPEPHKLAAPMLVLQGLGDLIVRPNTTISAFKDTCTTFTNSTAAELRLFPYLNHDPLMYAAMPQITAWVKDRFDGVPVPIGCSLLTETPEVLLEE